MAAAPDPLPPLKHALIDAGLAGLVAAAMALPMLGFHLEDSATGLSLSLHLPWVGLAALVVAGGRLALGQGGDVVGLKQCGH